MLDGRMLTNGWNKLRNLRNVSMERKRRRTMAWHWKLKLFTLMCVLLQLVGDRNLVMIWIAYWKSVFYLTCFCIFDIDYSHTSYQDPCNSCKLRASRKGQLLFWLLSKRVLCACMRGVVLFEVFIDIGTFVLCRMNTIVL